MKTWINKEDSLKAISKNIPGVMVGSSPQNQRITDWLSNLNLLYGVPFHNLIANPDLLPDESLRFFNVDANWMEALMDGALSIGRMTSTDIQNDQLRRSTLREHVTDAMATHRSKLTNTDPISEPSPPVAGFLLRSKLVKGWPGLEVKAYKNSGDSDPIKPLRMDRLSEEVMLVLYPSTFQEIILGQPPEGLQFGADDNVGTYTRDLRSLGIGKIPIGYDLSEVSYNKPVKSVTSFMRENDQRVVDVTKLVGKLKDGLKKDEELGPHFTSAEFAVQMLETAHRAIITISTNPS